VNFITCHDGFTLYDLYCYNQKHNLANGWNNTDGTDDNRSWNCGVEGETDDPKIQTLRRRLCRNACAVLMMSRGAPMFIAGDEFLNTQYGNNNPYCQDNEISWLDWSFIKKNSDMFEFYKFMIALRKKHDIIRGVTQPAACGFEDVSVHGATPYTPGYSYDDRYAGVMYAGRDKNDTHDEIIYVGMNMCWKTQNVMLPRLPEGLCWHKAVYTWEEPSTIPETQRRGVGGEFEFGPRSVAVFVAQ
jgi:glycogen operon protein